MGNMHDPDYQYFPAITSSYYSSRYESDQDDEEEYIDPFSPSSSSSRRASPSLYPPFASYIAPRETNKLRKSTRVSIDSYDSEEYSSTEEEVDLEDAEEIDARRDVSCSETIKRQFQSMSFNMTFRVFRARRRVREIFRR